MMNNKVAWRATVHGVAELAWLSNWITTTIQTMATSRSYIPCLEVWHFTQIYIKREETCNSWNSTYGSWDSSLLGFYLECQPGQGRRVSKRWRWCGWGVQKEPSKDKSGRTRSERQETSESWRRLRETKMVHKSFSSIQLLSHVQLFATPWITECQASLSITNSQSLLKLMSIELVMPSSHLILRRTLLILPPIPLSIRVFSNE